ncbi:MAG: site-2 protease family protein [Cyanobacteria bacterium SZAS LIN-3]|nr:site-2 protease family protein [Cyanobacteria bacterium SZAS LIN-3]
MNKIILLTFLIVASLLSSKVFGVVAALTIISVLITLHEFGHWLVARCFGIAVPIFSVGFGRADQATVLGHAWGTEFQLRPFPVGGFIAPDEKSFAAASFVGRAATLAAGPGMNLLIPVVLFFALFSASGVPVTTIDDVYVALLPNSTSIAATAGLQEGDRFLWIDGKRVEKPEQVVQALAAHKSIALTMIVGRSDQNQTITLVPDENGKIGVGIGAHISRSIRQVSVAEASVEAVAKTVGMTADTLSGYGSLLHGKNLKQLSSIVGIVAEGSEQVNSGISGGIYFTCVLSIALAILNLLPLPGLDGGQLVLLALEKARGRPLRVKTQGIMQLLVVVFFVGLFFLALYNDMVSLLGRPWATPALIVIICAVVYMLRPLLFRAAASDPGKKQ